VGTWTLDESSSCNGRPLYYKVNSYGYTYYFGVSASPSAGYVYTTSSGKCGSTGYLKSTDRNATSLHESAGSWSYYSYSNGWPADSNFAATCVPTSPPTAAPTSAAPTTSPTAPADSPSDGDGSSDGSSDGNSSAYSGGFAEAYECGCPPGYIEAMPHLEHDHADSQECLLITQAPTTAPTLDPYGNGLCEQVEVISAIDWVSGIWTLDRTESCNRRPLYFKDLSDGSKVYFGSATAYRDSSSSSYGGYVVTTEANKCTVNGDQYSTDNTAYTLHRSGWAVEI
jgi:hypothetical protein